MALYISSSESTFTELGLNATNALVKDDKIPIGCAFFGNASIIFFTSSSTIDFDLMSV